MTVKKESLKMIADALKEKGATGPFLFPDDFVSAIRNIGTGGDGEEKLRTVANLFTDSQFENLKAGIKEILQEYRTE